MVLAGIGLWTSFYTIPAESEGIVLRFGKYIDKVPSGLHFKLPFGIDSGIGVPIQRQLKQEFGFATPDYTNPDQAGCFRRPGAVEERQPAGASTSLI
jgi:membrane protease subunit HflK